MRDAADTFDARYIDFEPMCTIGKRIPYVNGFRCNTIAKEFARQNATQQRTSRFIEPGKGTLEYSI